MRGGDDDGDHGCHDTAASVEPTLGVRRKSRTNFQLAKQRFFRQKLAVVGLVLVVLFLLCAMFAPLLAPTGYADANLMDANKFPSREFPFGTDTIGHDMLSRVIYGIRTSHGRRFRPSGWPA